MEKEVKGVFTDPEVKLILDTKRKAKLALELCGITGHYAELCVIAGGCIVSWLRDEEPKDIDLFVLKKESNPFSAVSIEMRLMEMFQDKMKDLEDKTHAYQRGNDQITRVLTGKTSKVQVIFTKYKTREELIQHFDYVHCMVSYHEDKIYLTRKTFDAIMSKYLIVNNAGRTATWRKQKFLDRGWVEKPESWQETTKADLAQIEILKKIAAEKLQEMAKKTTVSDYDDNLSWLLESTKEYESKLERDFISKFRDVYQKTLAENNGMLKKSDDWM